MGWPVSAFHNRTVLSLLAEASRCPSGLNATLFTRSVCPVSGCADGWPVSAFHNRTVSSQLAEASRCPSGLNATPTHALVCPVSGVPRGWPVSASHNRTVCVAAGGGQPVPVGAERHTGTAGVPGQRCADGLAGVGVPQPHRVVAAGGGQPVPVGAERHTGTPGRCGRSAVPRLLAGVGVPQPDRVVAAGGGQPVPVGAERHTDHRAVCPVSGAPICWPVSASHNRIVLSPPAETSRCPSGLNATLDTGWCARSAVPRSAGRCRRSTNAPCGRRWRRPAGARRG